MLFSFFLLIETEPFLRLIFARHLFCFLINPLAARREFDLSAVEQLFNAENLNAGKVFVPDLGVIRTRGGSYSNLIPHGGFNCYTATDKIVAIVMRFHFIHPQNKVITINNSGNKENKATLIRTYGGVMSFSLINFGLGSNPFVYFLNAS